MYSNLVLVECICQQLVNINPKELRGWTPLHYAAYQNVYPLGWIESVHATLTSLSIEMVTNCDSLSSLTRLVKLTHLTLDVGGRSNFLCFRRHLPYIGSIPLLESLTVTGMVWLIVWCWFGEKKRAQRRSIITSAGKRTFGSPA